MRSRLAAVLVAASCLASPPALAQAQRPAWVLPTDAATALREPDRFAWQLFVALNWPANLATRAADPARRLGAEGPVTWESWELAERIFLPGGAPPPAWNAKPASLERTADDDGVPLQRARLLAAEPVPPGVEGHQHDEVRYNRPLLEFVAASGLYSIEGQERRFYARSEIEAPPESIAVKGVWRAIGEEDKPRYQWAYVTDKAGKRHLYGLASLHVMTKTLPDWFWATFEHVDNPFRGTIHDEGWLLPSRDTVACPPPHDPGCNRAPAGFGLERTRWEHYRLRGTQVAFTDSYGRPVVLANSELETGFQRGSSCMTCHARATIGPRINEAASFEFGPAAARFPLSPPTVNRLPVFRVLPDEKIASYNGAPDPAWFVLPRTGVAQWDRYLQLDYLWSLARAKFERPPGR